MRKRLLVAGGNEYVMAAGCLGLLLAIFFSPLALHDATFSSVGNLQRYYYPWHDPSRPLPRRLAPQADQATYVHPRQVLVEQALDRDGQLPLWDPLTLGGTPLMAEAGSRMAYPPYVLLTKVFNPVWMHDVYVILHLFAGGMFMFALLKQLGARFAGALLAAISWAFASYVMGLVMLEMMAAVVALLPLAVLLVRRWHDRRSIAALLGAGLVLGVLLLGSSVDLALLSFLVVAAYAGCLALRQLARRWREAAWGERIGIVAQPVLLPVVALGVAAVALLPFLELQSRSDRLTVPIDEQIDAFSVPARAFVHLFTPPPISDDVAKSVYSLNNEQAFVGTLTGLLAVVGFLTRRRGVGLGRALAVALFLLTTGTPITRAFYDVVPFIGNLTGFGKMLFLWDFGVALLGGIGLDVVLGAARRAAGRTPARRVSPLVVAAAVAGICLVATSAQLLVYGRRVNPPFQHRAASELFPATPAVDATRQALGDEAGRGRVLALQPVAGQHTLVATTGIALGLAMANGYEPFVDERVSTLWRVVAGEPEATALGRGTPGTVRQEFGPLTTRTELLSRVGVAAVVAPPGDVLGPRWTADALAPLGFRTVYAGRDGTVFAVPNAARARVVTTPVWVDNEAEAMARFTDPAFDPARQVVLEGPHIAAGPGPGGAGTVRWDRYEPDEVRLAVTSEQPGWLVLSDSWDPGWKATVNGRATEIRRADYGFRAVRVPAGQSNVRFRYRPGSLVAGVWISSVTLTVVGVAVVAGAWRPVPPRPLRVRAPRPARPRRPPRSPRPPRPPRLPTSVRPRRARRPRAGRRLRSEVEAVADGPDAARQPEGG